MKAILVMPEMPECCAGCHLHSWQQGFVFCMASDKRIKRITQKADLCPLRDLPEYKESIAEDYLSANWTDGYKLGWNDCLRAIEGSGEDGA